MFYLVNVEIRECANVKIGKGFVALKTNNGEALLLVN